MVIQFNVFGKPQPKQRPRVVKGHTFTPKETAEYEKLVRNVYRSIYKDFKFEKDAPLSATIDVFVQIPESASKKRKVLMQSGHIRPTGRPDLDNYIKSVLDAVNGVAFHDDSQIVNITANKFYAHSPMVSVKIEDAAGEENGR